MVIRVPGVAVHGVPATGPAAQPHATPLPLALGRKPQGVAPPAAGGAVGPKRAVGGPPPPRGRADRLPAGGRPPLAPHAEAVPVGDASAVRQVIVSVVVAEFLR